MRLLNCVFVVEGKNDYEKLLKCGVPYAVITKGYNVSRETIKHLQTLEKNHTIILLTDPDGPGKKIADRISATLVSPQIISVQKSVATSKKEVGIERVPLKTLQEIIAPYTQNEFISYSNVTHLDLLALNLSGPQSKDRKKKLIAHFSLLTGPLKTIHKQILLMNIKLDELKECLDG